MCDTYPAHIDHSQDFEIRKTKDGRMFAIRNLRLELDGKKAIFKADMAGDMDAAREYLKQRADYAKGARIT